jgi:uncharacterized protein (UPF0335 family)
MPDSCAGYSKIYTDKDGVALLERADKLDLEMQAIAAEFNALMAEAAKRGCSVVKVPCNVVSESKGDEC